MPELYLQNPSFIYAINPGMWGALQNIGAVDGSYASGVIYDQTTVSFKQFSSGNLPTSALITGLSVDLYGKSIGTNTAVTGAVLVGGTRTSIRIGNLTTSGSSMTIGGSGDLWDFPFVLQDIDRNLGVELTFPGNSTVMVDGVAIRVHYDLVPSLMGARSRFRPGKRYSQVDSIPRVGVQKVKSEHVNLLGDALYAVEKATLYDTAGDVAVIGFGDGLRFWAATITGTVVAHASGGLRLGILLEGSGTVFNYGYTVANSVRMVSSDRSFLQGKTPVLCAIGWIYDGTTYHPINVTVGTSGNRKQLFITATAYNVFSNRITAFDNNLVTITNTAAKLPSGTLYVKVLGVTQ